MGFDPERHAANVARVSEEIKATRVKKAYLSLFPRVRDAGLNATLPPGNYQWGEDAMESFNFGKRMATIAILQALGFSKVEEGLDVE